MALQPGTRALLSILHAQPSLRWQIRAARDRTHLYAASLFRPAWKEIADLKRTNSELAEKDTLVDVLDRLQIPGTTYSSLLAFVLDVEQPWQPDGFTVWRALSGIFASNAEGEVSFQIGVGVAPSRVFTAAELPECLRDPAVDPFARELLSYFQRCIDSRQPDINLGFLSM